MCCDGDSCSHSFGADDCIQYDFECRAGQYGSSSCFTNNLYAGLLFDHAGTHISQKFWCSHWITRLRYGHVAPSEKLRCGFKPAVNGIFNKSRNQYHCGIALCYRIWLEQWSWDCRKCYLSAFTPVHARDPYDHLFGNWGFDYCHFVPFKT